MKKLLLPVLIVLIFNGGLHAQRGRGLVDKSDESMSYLTLSIGPSFCFADTKKFALTQPVLSNYDFSVGYRKLFSSNFGYKLAFNYSNYSGNDTLSVTSTREYHFTTNVMQLALQAEYHIRIGRAYYYKPTPNSIYMFLGAGVMKSNANLFKNQDRAHYDYKINQDNYAPVIPFGFGYQYNLKDKFIIGAEMNWRFPFTDFVDGYSPPYPESKSNDITGGFSLTLTYLLGFEYLRRN